MVRSTNMFKTYSKGKETYKSKREKMEEKGTIPVESENSVQVPTWRFLIFKLRTLSANVGLLFIIVPLI